MTDESSAPPAPDPASPAAGPVKPGVRPGRPPAGRKTAPPPAPPGKFKAYLVIGIIVSTVVLVGLIAWRLIDKLGRKPQVVRNVKVEWENAWTKADQAWKDAFKVQSKVWVEEKEFTSEDLDKLRAALKTWQDTDAVFHELSDLVLREGKGPSREMQEMGPKVIILKAWIWDLNGVLDPAKKPPEYGGLYIPMYRAERRMTAALKRGLELRTQAQEINASGDIPRIEKTIHEVRGLRETVAGCLEEFGRLDTELLEGLTMPDLKKEQLRELEELREYGSKASMGVKELRDLRSLFPSLEDLAPKEPPKDPAPSEPPQEPPPSKDPPKESPPKEAPPTEEPPKEQPK